MPQLRINATAFTLTEGESKPLDLKLKKRPWSPVPFDLLWFHTRRFPVRRNRVGVPRSPEHPL